MRGPKLCLGYLRQSPPDMPSVLSGRRRSAARLDGASLLDCSNMARIIADDDGQKTPNVCPDQPHGREALDVAQRPSRCMSGTLS